MLIDWPDVLTLASLTMNNQFWSTETEQAHDSCTCDVIDVLLGWATALADNTLLAPKLNTDVPYMTAG